MNFKSEMQALVARHSIEGVLFVIVQNQDKSAKNGQMMVSVETCLPRDDTASGIFLLACKDKVESFIPEVFNNATRVTKNG